MTLNQIIARVGSLSLAHKQVRTFKRGLVTDFLADHTIPYPAVFLQDNGGTISMSGRAATFNFRLFFLDLAHVAADTRDNELDVQSDMVSVAMDLLAQFNHGDYHDWRLSTDNSLQLLAEHENDMTAGCYVDISISVEYAQNVCEVPSEIQSYTATLGRRMRITVNEDIVTGEITMLFTPLPSQYDVPMGQEIEFTDALASFILKSNLGNQIKFTAHESETGEAEIILTKL